MRENERALLPVGFHDELPADAILIEQAASLLVRSFQTFGYEYVIPPLMEFETSLLSGPGKALSKQTFRVLDPISHRMMGIRADMTVQLARIAATRLPKHPLPLRLAYAGPVLRVTSQDLHHERQLLQAGIELIGAANLEADKEIIFVAIEALSQLGIPDLTIDFSLPVLGRMLVSHFAEKEDDHAALTQGLIHKDIHIITTFTKQQAQHVLPLLFPLSEIATIQHHLSQLQLGEEALFITQQLSHLITALKPLIPNITITIDPLEYDGFEYHTGIGFTIFSKQSPIELGRGGRYHVTNNTTSALEAVGFTLYVNHLLSLLPVPALPRKILIPFGTPLSITHSLRLEGWVTVHCLEPFEDLHQEARKQGCQALYTHESPFMIPIT